MKDSEALSDTCTSVSSIIERFHCHENILKIQEAFNTSNFSFHEISEDEFRQENLRLDGTKSTPIGNIPAGMLKSTIDIKASILKKLLTYL